MNMRPTRKQSYLILAVTLIVITILAVIFCAYINRIPLGSSGPQPFAAGTVATYPYDFTGDPSGWTLDEAAVKVATYSGAEYIIIQDVQGDNTGALLIPPEKLKKIVVNNNCKQIEIDGSIRYILLSKDVANVLG